MMPPTLPIFPGIDDRHEGRAELLAGLTFVEGARGFGRAELRDWFRDNAGALGMEAPPVSVKDTLGGSAPCLLEEPALARHEDLSALLYLARWRVVFTLRGLLANPVDDRFLHAAIFGKRVRRHGGAWRVTAREDHPLSDIVLSLFAVDVLTHREFHEQNLCICDVCGRISYSPARTTQGGCVEHPPRPPDSQGRPAPRSSGARCLRRW
jgi:hypothetical protein